ncbi:unnamed protein product, partial [Phaeothamnion confervicola]
QVIIQDNTFGTNKFGINFFVIVCVDGEGRTRAVCQGFLKPEGTEAFTWAFERYMRF